MPCHRLALAAALVLLAVPTLASTSAWRHDHHSTTPPLVEVLPHLAAGDTLIWTMPDGRVDQGVLAETSGSVLQLSDGRQIDAADMDALWRRYWSKARGFGHRAGTGVVVGLVTAGAMANHSGRDNGGLENLGVALGATLAGGTAILVGVLVGATAPATAELDLLYARDPDADPGLLPPGHEFDESALQEGPWLEVGGELASVGWSGTSSGSSRAVVGFWYPLARRLAMGVNLGYGHRPAFHESEHWDDGHAFSASLDLRTEFGESRHTRPYLGLGVGHFGQLAGQTGWNLAMGLNSRVGEHTTLRTEVGSTAGIHQVGRDRPGLAYVAMRINTDLLR